MALPEVMRPELAVLQELVDIVPGPPLRRTDRRRFLRAVGFVAGASAIDVSIGAGNGSLLGPRAVGQAFFDEGCKKAQILRCIGDAAYDMPLPPRWSEQVDVRGFVYFAHASRTEATWEHPLLAAFRETLAVAGSIIDNDKPLDQAAAAVEAHLRSVQQRAAEHLADWTGPHCPDGGNSEEEFFHNLATGESSWENPLEAWQYELHVRYWLLVQLLQCLHGRQEGTSPNEALRGATPSSAASGSGRQENASAVDDGTSISGLSSAVRSRATEIASSLTSSAPSFRPDARFPVTPVAQTPPGSGPSGHPPKPPPRPSPPLRHLAAPPRLSDVPPPTVLRAPSTAFPGLRTEDAAPPSISSPAPPSAAGSKQRAAPLGPRRLGSESVEELIPLGGATPLGRRNFVATPPPPVVSGAPEPNAAAEAPFSVMDTRLATAGSADVTRREAAPVQAKPPAEPHGSPATLARPSEPSGKAKPSAVCAIA